MPNLTADEIVATIAKSLADGWIDGAIFDDEECETPDAFVAVLRSEMVNDLDSWSTLAQVNGITDDADFDVIWSRRSEIIDAVAEQVAGVDPR